MVGLPCKKAIILPVPFEKSAPGAANSKTSLASSRLRLATPSLMTPGGKSGTLTSTTLERRLSSPSS